MRSVLSPTSRCGEHGRAPIAPPREKDVKLQLKLIVDRRNKIVHEADVDPTPPRTRYAISAWAVGTSLDFLEDLVEPIDAAS